VRKTINKITYGYTVVSVPRSPLLRASKNIILYVALANHGEKRKLRPMIGGSVCAAYIRYCRGAVGFDQNQTILHTCTSVNKITERHNSR